MGFLKRKLKGLTIIITKQQLDQINRAAERNGDCDEIAIGIGRYDENMLIVDIREGELKI